MTVNGVTGCEGKQEDLLYLRMIRTHDFDVLCFILVGLKLSEEVGFWHVPKISKSDYYFVVSLLPSVRTEKLGSHWTNYHEVSYLSAFRKSVQKSQVSLKYNRNNSHFARGTIFVYDNISLNSP